MRHDKPDLRFLAGVPVPIQVVEISNDASVDVTLPSGFDEYRVEIRKYIPITDNTDLRFTCSDNNGSSFHTSAGDYETSLQTIDSTTTSSALNTANSVGLRLGTAGVEHYNANIEIRNPGDGTLPFNAFVTGSGLGAAGSTGLHSIGMTGMTSAGSVLRITTLRFFASSGNMESGIITLYGIRNTSVL